MARTPLAWCNITHDRVRFLLFVVGIVFAVVLMFVQLGFRGALLDSNTLVHEKLNAEFVLVSPSRSALTLREPVPRRRLAQARSVPGVAAVHSLFIDNGLGTLRNTDPDATRRTQTRVVRVIGVDPEAFMLKLPALDPQHKDYAGVALKMPGTALYDRRTKDDVNEITQQRDSVFGKLAPGTTTELSGHQLTLVGAFDLGSDFTAEGTVIVSEETFAEILRRPYTLGAPLADVDLGLVRLAPGADHETVRAALRAALAPGDSPPATGTWDRLADDLGLGAYRPPTDADVEVLTPDELSAREKAFWLSNTPIGFAFGFGMFMGFAVGTIICYQILSGDVADHLGEYATLKAVGYGNAYLAWVVLQEALILAVVGFIVGFGLSWLAYLGLTEYTGLPLRMGVERAVSVFLATVAMCVASALIALIRLLRADPADVF